MIFKCRNCGKTSSDIDMVLDGTCECGCAHFELTSEKPFMTGEAVSPKEALRRDLHLWLDLNIDSIDVESLHNMRVRLEFDQGNADLQG